MQIEWQWATVALAMMALDVVCGFAEAVKNKEVASDKMREGLWQKGGFLGAILLSVLLEAGCEWLSINMGELLPASGVESLPLVAGVSLFVIALEAVSVTEHLCALNPAIGKLPLVRSLKKLESEVEEAAETTEGGDVK